MPCRLTGGVGTGGGAGGSASDEGPAALDPGVEILALLLRDRACAAATADPCGYALVAYCCSFVRSTRLL